MYVNDHHNGTFTILTQGLNCIALCPVHESLHTCDKGMHLILFYRCIALREVSISGPRLALYCEPAFRLPSDNNLTSIHYFYILTALQTSLHRLGVTFRDRRYDSNVTHQHPLLSVHESYICYVLSSTFSQFTACRF